MCVHVLVPCPTPALPRSQRPKATAWLNGLATRVALGLVMTLGAFASTAVAQKGDAEPFAPLAAPSRIWAFWPSSMYFEGDPMVPLPLRSRTKNIRTIPAESATVAWRGSGSTFTIVPHFTFRQTSEKAERSAPVLTPTFNPYLEYSWFSLATRPGSARRRLFPSFAEASRLGSIRALQVRVGHYSNGQSGCLYAAATQDSTGNCSSVPAGAALNVRSGSFSTNYIDAVATHGWLWFDSSLAERVLMSLSAGARHNPKGAGMNAELANAYGRTSVSARAEIRLRTDSSFGFTRRLHPPTPVVARLSGEVQRYLARASGYPATARSVEVSFSFPRAYGFGVLARYQDGTDYYNVAFGTRLQRKFSVGLMFDHSRQIALTQVAKTGTRQTFR